jgi:leucyl-tRNA synthetase
MQPYDHKNIESKWRNYWDQNKIYRTFTAGEALSLGKNPYYVLDMFPYPSGAGLHVGHPRGYIASDVLARMKRMQGYNVLHPMGFDSFGLPAEQYAIQTGENPAEFTEELVKRYQEQLSILGFSYDWDRMVATHRPEYYKWTQWIFLQIYNSWYDTRNPPAGGKARSIDELIEIFEREGSVSLSYVGEGRGEVFTATDWQNLSPLEKQNILMKYRLAYEGYAEVNWCEELGTVLANDEIVDDEHGNPVSERGGHPVVKKSMRQWFMRITAYADRLLAGLDTIDWSESIKEIQRNWIGKQDGEAGNTTYNIRDAIFARQRYWGEPIPLQSHDGIITEVSQENLPLTLPHVTSYAPAGDGQSPLAMVPAWTDAGYETNTMPGWAGSSWYFLRYIDPNNDSAFASQEELDYWFSEHGGVNTYIGGTEHATGHLLYSRFWHKVLHDLGYVKTDEPFLTLKNQGMILAEDGRKMSKRWGNVINPDDMVKQFGADTMRVYEMFMGPFAASQPWSTDGMVGSRRFIERVWRVAINISKDSHTDENILKTLHKTIKKVSDDIVNFSHNTAISAMMILINDIEKYDNQISVADYKQFLQILAPFAPHITEELWSKLDTSPQPSPTLGEGAEHSIHLSDWPSYDESLIIENTITLGIQVNGKVRAEIEIAVDESVESVQEKVLAIPEIQKWIGDSEIKKFIYVPKKIISIVI